jgi:uncharacterized protein (TIGR03083 family)
MPSKLPKIETIELFSQLDGLLIDVLKSLKESDWDLPTLAPKWQVKDLVAHLLDGNLRALSMLRDGYFGDKPGEIDSYTDLLAYLNKLNEDWVKSMTRLSPKVLIDLLESSGKEYILFLKSLNPENTSKFSVAWAGESESKNWFHIAREYTEKWHHQQQIRWAIGATEPLYTFELYHPYLETSMRALPHHYRNTQAENGDVIEFNVEHFGSWFLVYLDEKWILSNQESKKPICKTIIPKDLAWRIFTKGIKPDVAKNLIHFEGPSPHLGEQILDMLAVMA